MIRNPRSKALRFALGGLYVAVLLGLVALPLALVEETQGQAPPPDPVNTNSKLEWAHDMKDINGAQEIIGRFEIAISATNQDLSMGGTALMTLQVQYPCPECVTDTTTLGVICTYPIAELIRGRTSGYYRLWVRAVDAAANVGAWSQYLTVQTDSAPPKPPTGLKCK